MVYGCGVTSPSQPAISTLTLNLTFSNNMYLLTEWEGRTGKYLARGQGVRTERSEVRVPPDREPNIFPSGPPTQSISILSYDHLLLKSLKILNRTRLHKIGRLRARNNDTKVSTTKICHLFRRVEQEIHNSSKNTTRFLTFVFTFVLVC